MLELKELNYESAKEEYQFFTCLDEDNNGFINPYYQVSYQEFYDSIRKRIENSKGREVDVGLVPDTFFFLWEDEKIVGLYKVRHYLNECLRNGSGHIGYLILPQYRGKGYGSKGLKLAIDKLIKMEDFKEDEVYLSCDKSNSASLKVMLNNGGYIHHQDDKKNYVRIKIEK